MTHMHYNKGCSRLSRIWINRMLRKLTVFLFVLFSIEMSLPSRTERIKYPSLIWNWRSKQPLQNIIALPICLKAITVSEDVHDSESSECVAVACATALSTFVSCCACGAGLLNDQHRVGKCHRQKQDSRWANATVTATSNATSKIRISEVKLERQWSSHSPKYEQSASPQLGRS